MTNIHSLPYPYCEDSLVTGSLRIVLQKYKENCTNFSQGQILELGDIGDIGESTLQFSKLDLN